MDKLSNRKVVVWVPRFWPAMGGTELHTYELSSRLATHCNVEVVTHCDRTAHFDRSLYTDVLKTTSSQHRLNGLLVNRIGLSTIDLPIVRWIAREHSNYKFARPIFTLLYRTFARCRVRDAELVHFIYNGMTDAAVYACDYANDRNIPFVFTPNVLNTETSPSAWNSTRFKKLYKKSDAIIALTQHEADYLVSQGANPAKITVVPYGPVLSNSADANRAKEMLALKDERIVLFLGRMVSQKGYRLLLDAFDKIEKIHPKTVLVFMGPATDDVKYQIETQSHRRIVLIDTSDQQVKTDMLSACELVCVPSSLESLGVVYLEAFACAKPVVALDLPVLRDVITHGKDGLMVEPNALAIATAVCDLLDDPKKAHLMGLAGLKKVSKRYSWDAVVRSLLNIYSHAINRTDTVD